MGSDQRTADLSRCSYCGRKGTLTELSAGNTCVIVEPCEAARRDAIERAEAIRG